MSSDTREVLSMNDSPCDPAGIRTQDPYIKSVLLYQLSYGIFKYLKRKTKFFKLIKTYQIVFLNLCLKCYSLKSWCKSTTFDDMMQTYFLNFLKIFLTSFLLTMQLTDSQAQRALNKKADSLFNQKKNDEAVILYEQILKNSQNISPNVYLKLANISENKGNYVKELYYLNLYFFKEPNEKVFEKMFVIANENGYKGYEKNDLNYILFYYRKYSSYIWGAFLILGIYIFSVLLIKRRNKQYSPIHHKIIFIVYLLFLLSLINLPNNYRSAIIKNEKVYLRNYPSAASQIVGNISEGNRLNIIKSDDIWYQVLWEGQFCYIKSSDIWLVK